jgi:hypothetical protein
MKKWFLLLLIVSGIIFAACERAAIDIPYAQYAATPAPESTPAPLQLPPPHTSLRPHTTEPPRHTPTPEPTPYPHLAPPDITVSVLLEPTLDVHNVYPFSGGIAAVSMHSEKFYLCAMQE